MTNGAMAVCMATGMDDVDSYAFVSIRPSTLDDVESELVDNQQTSAATVQCRPTGHKTVNGHRVTVYESVQAAVARASADDVEPITDSEREFWANL